MFKSRSTTCFLSLIFISLICLGSALLGGYVIGLPNQAATLFGASDPSLDLTQEIYLSAKLLSEQNDLLNPVSKEDINVNFQVTLGEPTSSIAANLAQYKLIPNAGAFLDFLVYSGLDKTIQAGEYQLNTNMTPIDIANALQDATPYEVSLNILPGWRIEEIAETIPTSGLSFTPEAFLQFTTNPPDEIRNTLEIPQGKPLEGFLFPDLYLVQRDAPVEELINQMTSNFNIKVNQELRDGFSRQGLSLYQAVILASIVEREAVVDEEMSLIASVFYNRLNTQMKLDSDPTVQYAIGYDAETGSWWKNPLTANDLQTNSPYNTYLYPGLPPSPIANPSLNALKAVAFPASTPYYYFRAACDGSGRHQFVETFNEHLNNACP